MRIGNNFPNISFFAGNHSPSRALQLQDAQREASIADAPVDGPTKAESDELTQLQKTYTEMAMGEWDGNRRIPLDGIQPGYVETMTDDEYKVAFGLNFVKKLKEFWKFSEDFRDFSSGTPSADRMESWKADFRNRLMAYNDLVDTLTDQTHVDYIRRMLGVDSAEEVISERNDSLKSQLKKMHDEIQGTVTGFGSLFNLETPLASFVDGRWVMN